MDIYRRSPDYRGARPSPLRRLGQLFFALILLGGLAAGLFLLFFRGYVVEGPDGLQLQPPLLKAGTRAAPVSGTVDNVTLPEEPSAIAPTPSPDPLQAVYLPLDTLVDGSYEEALRQNRGNAVLFDMKDRRGNLGFVSEQPLAIDSGASAADPERNDTISAMNREEDLYTIARIACFRDDTLIAQRPDLSLLRVSGSPWRDEDGAPWLSPASGEVQSYLLELCREAAALGFDEVLLTHCAYPTKGSLEDLPDACRDIDASETVLEDFYSEVRALLEQEGVRLSILWESSPSDDRGRPLSGQTVQGVMLGAHRIWTPEVQAVQTFDVGQPPREGSALVTIRSEPGDAGASWAICPAVF